MGFEFQVVASEAHEIHPEQLTAREVSQINAYRKARAVAKKFPDALVIGADTLVYLETTLLGKPIDLEAAYGMLELLQGKTHDVITAICLLHLRERRHKVFSDTTAVTFLPLDAVKIRRYLNRVDPLDKAGAYAIQEQGDLIVEKISGSVLECGRVAGGGVGRGTCQLGPVASAGSVGGLTGSRPGQFLPEVRAHQLAFGKAIQVEFLVGRVRVVVGQGQAEQEGVGAQDLLEVVDNRDGAAFAHEDGFGAESGFERAQGGLGLRAGGRNEVRLGAVAGFDFQADGGRAEILQVFAEGLE